MASQQAGNAQTLVGGEFAMNQPWVSSQEPVQTEPAWVALCLREGGDSLIFLGTDQITFRLVLSDVGTTL